MRDMGKDDKSIHRLLLLHARTCTWRAAAMHVRLGDQGTLAVVAPSLLGLGAHRRRGQWAGRCQTGQGEVDDVSATYPGPVAWKGGGAWGRGGCEGIRTHSRDSHGSGPAVDLPLTLVASVPLPGCVVPGAGLVGGTGMGRMEKETDLRKGAQRGGARVRGPTMMGK